ncbi:MAG: inositol monophosphatase family protein, partial [Bacillota bacterium]
MLNLQEVRDKIVELVLEVGKFQLMNLGKENLRIDTKSTGIDLVTEVDKKSEAAIIDFIRGHYPGHDILAEESGLSADRAAYRWIVDP